MSGLQLCRIAEYSLCPRFTEAAISFFNDGISRRLFFSLNARLETRFRLVQVQVVKGRKGGQHLFDFNAPVTI